MENSATSGYSYQARVKEITYREDGGATLEIEPVLDSSFTRRYTYPTLSRDLRVLLHRLGYYWLTKADFTIRKSDVQSGGDDIAVKNILRYKDDFENFHDAPNPVFGLPFLNEDGNWLTLNQDAEGNKYFFYPHLQENIENIGALVAKGNPIEIFGKKNEKDEIYTYGAREAPKERSGKIYVTSIDSLDAEDGTRSFRVRYKGKFFNAQGQIGDDSESIVMERTYIHGDPHLGREVQSWKLGDAIDYKRWGAEGNDFLIPQELPCYINEDKEWVQPTESYRVSGRPVISEDEYGRSQIAIGGHRFRVDLLSTHSKEFADEWRELDKDGEVDLVRWLTVSLNPNERWSGEKGFDVSFDPPLERNWSGEKQVTLSLEGCNADKKNANYRFRLSPESLMVETIKEPPSSASLMKLKELPPEVKASYAQPPPPQRKRGTPEKLCRDTWDSESEEYRLHIDATSYLGDLLAEIVKEADGVGQELCLSTNSANFSFHKLECRVRKGKEAWRAPQAGEVFRWAPDAPEGARKPRKPWSDDGRVNIETNEGLKEMYLPPHLRIDGTQRLLTLSQGLSLVWRSPEEQLTDVPFQLDAKEQNWEKETESLTAWGTVPHGSDNMQISAKSIQELSQSLIFRHGESMWELSSSLAMRQLRQEAEWTEQPLQFALRTDRTFDVSLQPRFLRSSDDGEHWVKPSDIDGLDNNALFLSPVKATAWDKEGRINFQEGEHGIKALYVPPSLRKLPQNDALNSLCRSARQGEWPVSWQGGDELLKVGLGSRAWKLDGDPSVIVQLSGKRLPSKAVLTFTGRKGSAQENVRLEPPSEGFSLKIDPPASLDALRDEAAASDQELVLQMKKGGTFTIDPLKCRLLFSEASSQSNWRDASSQKNLYVQSPPREDGVVELRDSAVKAAYFPMELRPESTKLLLDAHAEGWPLQLKVQKGGVTLKPEQFERKWKNDELDVTLQGIRLPKQASFVVSGDTITFNSVSSLDSKPVTLRAKPATKRSGARIFQFTSGSHTLTVEDLGNIFDLSEPKQHGSFRGEKDGTLRVEPLKQKRVWKKKNVRLTVRGTNLAAEGELRWTDGHVTFTSATAESTPSSDISAEINPKTAFANIRDAAKSTEQPFAVRVKTDGTFAPQALVCRLFVHGEQESRWQNLAQVPEVRRNELVPKLKQGQEAGSSHHGAWMEIEGASVTRIYLPPSECGENVLKLWEEARVQQFPLELTEENGSTSLRSAVPTREWKGDGLALQLRASRQQLPPRGAFREIRWTKDTVALEEAAGKSQESFTFSLKPIASNEKAGGEWFEASSGAYHLEMRLPTHLLKMKGEADATGQPLRFFLDENGKMRVRDLEYRVRDDQDRWTDAADRLFLPRPKDGKVPWDDNGCLELPLRYGIAASDPQIHEMYVPYMVRHDKEKSRRFLEMCEQSARHAALMSLRRGEDGQMELQDVRDDVAPLRSHWEGIISEDPRKDFPDRHNLGLRRHTLSGPMKR